MIIGPFNKLDESVLNEASYVLVTRRKSHILYSRDLKSIIITTKEAPTIGMYSYQGDIIFRGYPINYLEIYDSMNITISAGILLRIKDKYYNHRYFNLETGKLGYRKPRKRLFSRST